jgi:uncharacterized protein (DUF427 family)
MHLGKELKDAAWYYPEPKEKAKHIKDHVAFCKYLQPQASMAMA